MFEEDDYDESYVAPEDEIAVNEVNIVAKFISDTFHPDMQEVLYYIDDVFAKFNSGHHLAEVENLLLEENDWQDPSILKYKVLGIYEASLKDALAAFGVDVTSECKSYLLMAQMLDTLALAQYQYEKEFILPLLEFDEVLGADQTYCDLVSALTGARSDDVLEVLFGFKDRMMVKLKELVSRGEDDPLEISLDSVQSRISLDRYKTFLNGRRYGIIFNLTRKSLGYGMFDWKELYLLTEDELSGIRDKDLYYELASLLLVSNLDVLDSNELDLAISKLSSIYTDKPSETIAFKRGLLKTLNREEDLA